MFFVVFSFVTVNILDKEILTRVAVVALHIGQMHMLKPMASLALLTSTAYVRIINIFNQQKKLTSNKFHPMFKYGVFVYVCGVFPFASKAHHAYT